MPTPPKSTPTAHPLGGRHPRFEHLSPFSIPVQVLNQEEKIPKHEPRGGSPRLPVPRFNAGATCTRAGAGHWPSAGSLDCEPPLAKAGFHYVVLRWRLAQLARRRQWDTVTESTGGGGGEGCRLPG